MDVDYKNYKQPQFDENKNKNPSNTVYTRNYIPAPSENVFKNAQFAQEFRENCKPKSNFKNVKEELNVEQEENLHFKMLTGDNNRSLQFRKEQLEW